MKKSLIYILVFMMSVMMSFTGCNKNNQESEVKEEPVQEIKVYCAKCAAESNKLTKVCESCNEETTWAVEKPEIQEYTEEKIIDLKDNNDTSSDNQNISVCGICGKSDVYDNLVHLHGIGTVHKSCYDSYPKCENCGNNLFEFESDTPGLCFTCGN